MVVWVMEELCGWMEEWVGGGGSEARATLHATSPTVVFGHSQQKQTQACVCFDHKTIIASGLSIIHLQSRPHTFSSLTSQHDDHEEREEEEDVKGVQRAASVGRRDDKR